MPQRVTVDLDNGAYVFEPTTRFSIRDMANIREDGRTESFETLIALEGKLIGEAPDPASSTFEKHKKLRLQMFKETPIRVQIKLDGATQFDFDPAKSIGSPKIREITERSDGASHATHVTYDLSIYVKQPSKKDDVSNFEVEMEATYYNGLLQQKIWRAEAEGRTLAAARAFVLKFKPSGVKPLLERYHESLRKNKFSAEWIYDKTTGDGIVRVTERVGFTPSGGPVIVEPRVGLKAKPAVFRGRLRPAEFDIELTVEATSPDLIKEPTPHFTAGDDFSRDVTKETGQLPDSIFDSSKGLYRAVFREHWVFTGTGVPGRDHGGHDKPFEDKPLPDITGGVPFK